MKTTIKYFNNDIKLEDVKYAFHKHMRSIESQYDSAISENKDKLKQLTLLAIVGSIMTLCNAVLFITNAVKGNDGWIFNGLAMLIMFLSTLNTYKIVFSKVKLLDELMSYRMHGRFLEALTALFDMSDWLCGELNEDVIGVAAHVNAFKRDDIKKFVVDNKQLTIHYEDGTIYVIEDIITHVSEWNAITLKGSGIFIGNQEFTNTNEMEVSEVSIPLEVVEMVKEIG